MSRFTVLRVEVDSDAVERVLGLTPGVEVVEGFDAATQGRTPPAGEPDTGDSDDEREPADDAGPPTGATSDGGSRLREYGPLGVGVSFVMLGIAIAGIWWYRRRQRGTDDGEYGPAPEPTAFETHERTPRETPSTPTETDDEPTLEETEDRSLSIVSPDDGDGEAEEGDDESAASDDETVAADDANDGPADRDDVEWTTKRDSGEPDAGTAERDADEDADGAVDREGPRASASVDVAPLLGVAFIAVSGAVARWVSGDEQ
jgi:hypothetical protein